MTLGSSSRTGTSAGLSKRLVPPANEPPSRCARGTRAPRRRDDRPRTTPRLPAAEVGVGRKTLGPKRTLSLSLHLTCICRSHQAHSEEDKPREQCQARGADCRTIAEAREEHAQDECR